MRIKIPGLINIKKNLRLQILLAVLLSFILAMLVMILFANLLNPTPFAYQLFFVPPLSFILSFFVFFSLLTRKIKNYMRMLAEGIMQMAEGNLRYRIPLTRQDELGDIANSLNHMAVQIQQSIDRERKLEQSKIELITGLSHDLRTPLTSISGYLNLIQNEAYRNEEEHKRFVENASQKTEQLRKLIDDLFEYTRLINRDIQLSLRKIEWKHLAEQIIYEFEPIANEQGLAVTKQWDADHVIVEADAEKLARAMDNLLMNALKFSLRPGEIKVRLFSTKDRAILAMENMGKPISKEAEARLFERFYKAEPSRSEGHMPSGSGLGLSIAKNIVELHGGSLSFEHRNGRFTFYIELPLDSG